MRLLFLVLAGFEVRAAMTVSLQASSASPVGLGTPVVWTASAAGASAGTLFYRFQVAGPSGAVRTVVDFGPKAALTWTTIEQEGSYQMEVSVMNTVTGEQAATAGVMVFSPLVFGSGQVVTASANPNVFIYSASACPEGERMRVQIEAAGGGLQYTPYQSCVAGVSRNFYLAGMAPGATYQVRQVLDGSRTGSAAALSVVGLAVSGSLPVFTALTGVAPAGVLVQSLLGSPALASDLKGNPVWQGPADVTFLTRPVTGGTFMGIGEDGTQPPSAQFFREFDLAGITVAETNAARVNQQLGALGVRAINGFHHEARKLPDRGYLVLADSERLLTNVQGAGTVDVIGDTIVVLDQNLQVTWAWDAFDHLDNSRLASLGETCTYPPGLTCAPFYLAPMANDWLHGNSLQLTPDGNILYSTRHQDWVIKINYSNGTGSGNILWRMGIDGDFGIQSPDPFPWFSHQHDPNFEANDKVMLVFDDGNLRAAADPSAHSRGQGYRVDEINKVVLPELNADLGVYSGALGSAQLLPDGNYHFDAGFILSTAPDGTPVDNAQSLEVDLAGKIVFGVQFGALEYRTFRMPDLYTAPEDWVRGSVDRGFRGKE